MHKILLVDDERIFHFLTSKMFEVSGFQCEVQSAFDGKEAIAKLDGGFVPDFIFVDLDMPVMNGFDFLENYSKRGLSAKVIVLSSANSDDERSKVIALGAHAYISKSISENDVKYLLGGI